MTVRPYNECFFKTTHNSYRFSLKEQLNYGIRGLELNLHGFPSIFRFIKKKDNFKVVYWIPSHRDYFFGDNPFLINTFKNLVEIIYKWPKKHDHGPITVFLDIKGNFIDQDSNPSEKYGLQ